MADFDIAREVELGDRAAGEEAWEKAKADIPRHDAEFAARQAKAERFFEDVDGYGEPTLFYGDPDDIHGNPVVVVSKYRLTRPGVDLWALVAAKLIGGAA